MALQFIWACTILASLLYVASSETAQPPCTSTSTGTCSASVSVTPTQPGHAGFMYNNINVQNTGSCSISKVFVDITLPPYAPVFAYYNVSNQTGELFGVTDNTVSPGSTLLGGVIVLESARTPLVSMGSVECDPACSGTPQATRRARTPITQPESEPTKFEVQWGANPAWIAIHLIGDADTTKEVRLSHTGSASQYLMKRENWDGKVMFTFSGEKMDLPLSLELTSVENDKITLADAITSFSHAVVDTGLSYTGSQSVNITQCDVTLKVHPDSNSHWIGIKPQSPRNVARMFAKAQNAHWVPMQAHTNGFFELTSRNLAIQLPISVKLAFDDSSSLVIENAVTEFSK
eukprot:Phypoly_transcript_11233.p1 GENE.Phypoly_transcript_11233~~Phypoly_transcript_11233.p1  ORF type:complete len:362 (+),score=58.20 Phypoly_transcript_11233:48-1088(+)